MSGRQPCWDFRPTAYADNYKNATYSSLIEQYVKDGSRGAAAAAATADDPASVAITIPRKPQNCIRVTQWNIHYLSAPWLGQNSEGRRSGHDEYDSSHADQVAACILDAASDIAVLNEFGAAGRDPHCDRRLERLCRRLEVEGGYTIHDLASDCGVGFPTAVATRLVTVLSSDGFKLDAHRAAVRVTVDLGTIEAEEDGDGMTNGAAGSTGTNTASSMPLHIYGTHLDDSWGERRHRETKNLIANVDADVARRRGTDPVLIVGDFNQQRACDYTPDEWEVICENKSRRGSPEDDGVSALLQDAGFRCCYDQQKQSSNNDIGTNWRVGDSPPPTHWSSTVIDYAYRRNIEAAGIYVLPYNLSDHRMVVTDWRVVSATK